MLGILIGALSMGVIFLLGSVGEIITEKSGHLNLGIPGIMCLGTAGGCFGVSICANSGGMQWITLLSLPPVFCFFPTH